MARIGLFGGTFDPVHLGHLILAETARQECDLDEVRFIPARIPPHKQDRSITPPKSRIEMLEFAIAGNPHFTVDPIEVKQDRTSYTVGTLEQLTAAYPNDKFILLIGADSLNDFPTWREPGRILEMANVVAVNRGHDHADLDAVQSALGESALDRIRLIDMPSIGISASELRADVQAGKSIRYRTPRSVELYIQQNGLYREG